MGAVRRFIYHKSDNFFVFFGCARGETLRFFMWERGELRETVGGAIERLTPTLGRGGRRYPEAITPRNIPKPNRRQFYYSRPANMDSFKRVITVMVGDA